MGSLDKKSIRQRIIRLGVGESMVAPLERYDYLVSMSYRIAKIFKRKYTCLATEKQIKVTRTA